MTAYEVRKRRIEPLWDRVDRNRVELALFVLLFLVSSAIGMDVLLGVVLLGLFFVGGSPDWWVFVAANLGRIFFVTSLVAMAVAAVYAGWALTRSEKWLLDRLDAVLVPLGEMLPTKHALKDMAIAAGYEVAPALYLMETSNVNAFVFAHSHRRAVVGVTRGFVERLETDEQRAVFASLVARLRQGDTMWATGVTALMRPMWALTDRSMRDDTENDRLLGSSAEEWERKSVPLTATAAQASMGIVWLFAVAWVFVVVSTLILAGHQSLHLRHSEKSDAEGMLLLKDPRAMLRALEKCVRFNNFVPGAGPGYALLFFCYTGDSTDDAEDPEMRRVVRLREVLGAEALAPPAVLPNERVLAPPAAPVLAAEPLPAEPVWSVAGDDRPRASVWLPVGWAVVAIAVFGGLAWLAMYFDASLPRAAVGSEAYDTASIGRVFVTAYWVLGLVAVGWPVSTGLLDGRLIVGLATGAVSALGWIAIAGTALADYAGLSSTAVGCIALTIALGGLAGVATNRAARRAVRG